jgi:hypothetical protein
MEPIDEVIDRAKIARSPSLALVITEKERKFLLGK